MKRKQSCDHWPLLKICDIMKRYFASPLLISIPISLTSNHCFLFFDQTHHRLFTKNEESPHHHHHHRMMDWRSRWCDFKSKKKRRRKGNIWCGMSIFAYSLISTSQMRNKSNQSLNHSLTLERSTIQQRSGITRHHWSSLALYRIHINYFNLISIIRITTRIFQRNEFAFKLEKQINRWIGLASFTSFIWNALFDCQTTK